MLKKISLLLILIIKIGIAWAIIGSPSISFNQFINHEALDDAANGIETALKERGLECKINKQNAQGNVAIAAQIAKNQSIELPEVIVAIGTPSAQAAYRNYDKNKTLLAFVAITDPIAAGLTPEKNLIGVTDTPPMSELIDIVIKTMPERKKIGVIFNPGEINSVTMVKKLNEIANDKGLQIITAPINSTLDIKPATQTLINQVDIIYLPQDNFVFATIDSIVQVANTNKIPVISNVPSVVTHGLLLSLGCNYFSSGKQLGNMIADHLSNKKVEPVIQLPKEQEYKINEKVANFLGIDLNILKRARK